MEKNDLLFLVILVVGIGVAYVAINQAYSSGNVVSSSSCIDSDGGLDYYTYGHVTFRNSNSYDYCSGNSVMEMYCSGNVKAIKKYNCRDGCYDGQCGKTPCVMECNSVGLKECLSTTVGAAYRACGNYDADQCLEWSSPIYCPTGYGCSAGLCTRKS